MASLVSLYSRVTGDCVLTSLRLNRPARVLQFLSHEGAVRRDRAKHLQTLPNFWERNLGHLTWSSFTVVIIAPSE